nr:Uncharacterised protein [Klebsiella pneumoniae]
MRRLRLLTLTWHIVRARATALLPSYNSKSIEYIIASFRNSYPLLR